MSNTTSDYHTEIKIKFGELDSIINWCKSNCTGEWNLTISEEAGSEPGRYVFHFFNELDYVTFLIWKS